MTTTKVRIGDVLELVRRPVEVDPANEYKEIGVRSFGRGIFHKEPVMGSELGNKRVFYIEPGDLVFSNVFAWEGAVALAREQDAGRIGSHRFMTYKVNEQIADPTYLNYFFYSDPGLATVRRASPGSAGRNRTLGIKNFAVQEVDLPDLAEQRRIAAKLSSAFSHLNTYSNKANDRIRTRQATFDATIARTLGFTTSDHQYFKCLGDVARINPRPERIALEDRVAFVPMSKVNDHSGSIEQVEHKRAVEIGKGYKQFVSGDVLFARITPCMQNGKSAVFQDPSAAVGLGSTEFHVVRSDGSVSPDWIHAALRSRIFRNEASQNMSGTAGQQRISASFLEAAMIPIPSSKSSEEGILDKLSLIDQKRMQVESLHKQQEEHLKALRSSLLNAAFSGKL